MSSDNESTPPKKMLAVLLALTVLESRGEDRNSLRWDKWSWALPQEPIEYFFRRSESMPVKAPAFECKCPPNKECTVDYKINEAMGDFLHLRGVMHEEELEQFKESVKEIQAATKVEKELEKKQHARNALISKRNMQPEDEQKEECCCPPRSLVIPTFITDQKYDDIVNRFDNTNATNKK